MDENNIVGRYRQPAGYRGYRRRHPHRHQEKAEHLDENAAAIRKLREAIAKQTLVIQALTRFLIGQGLVNETDLESFIDEVDAEDGTKDGKATGASGAAIRSAHPPLVTITEGTYRKAEARGPD